VLISTTPVDDETTEVFGTYWLQDIPGSTPEDRTRRLNEIKQALPQDLDIWDHQIYLEPPALATSEAAGFRRLRRWTSKFYPDAASRTALHSGAHDTGPHSTDQPAAEVPAAQLSGA
jgi:hypothetical protein